MTGVWIILGGVVVLVLVAIGFLVATVVSLFKRHWARAAIRLAVGVVLLILAGLILPRVAVARPHLARANRCMSNLSQLGKAMRMYAMDHDEAFPSSFVALTNYMSNPRLYVCPYSGTTVGPIQTADQWADYILVTNLTERSQKDLVHVYCKPGNHRDNKGINVLFVDGSVQWFRESDFGTLTCDVQKGSRINNKEPQPEARGYRR